MPASFLMPVQMIFAVRDQQNLGAWKSSANGLNDSTTMGQGLTPLVSGVDMRRTSIEESGLIYGPFRNWKFRRKSEIVMPRENQHTTQYWTQRQVYSLDLQPQLLMGHHHQVLLGVLGNISLMKVHPITQNSNRLPNLAHHQRNAGVAITQAVRRFSLSVANSSKSIAQRMPPILSSTNTAKMAHKISFETL